MKKIFLFVAVCLACFQTAAWATDFCSQLDGTKWQGYYKIDATGCHCQFNETFTFSKGGMRIHSTRTKAKGLLSGYCPRTSDFTLGYSCKNNSQFSYLSKDGTDDRVYASLSANRLYNGGGSYQDTIKVNYQLDMRKQ